MKQLLPFISLQHKKKMKMNIVRKKKDALDWHFNVKSQKSAKSCRKCYFSGSTSIMTINLFRVTNTFDTA